MMHSTRFDILNSISRKSIICKLLISLLERRIFSQTLHMKYRLRTGSYHSFYLRRSRQNRERKVFFFFLLLLLLLLGDLGGTVFRSPMYTQNGCINKKTSFQNGHIQRKHFLKKWVDPAKTFLQNGCIQRKLFPKMGAFKKTFCCTIDASRQSFTSK